MGHRKTRGSLCRRRRKTVRVNKERIVGSAVVFNNNDIDDSLGGSDGNGRREGQTKACRGLQLS